ncbi:MAG TPA: DUF5666 domain-containing protein [Candidatus Angelobacter sp.]|nr:DUF5666 domain-containing protein [Candidatus Angelobacter sp.]
MKRVYLFTVLCVVFALMLTGCGGGNNTVTAASQSGNVTIQTGDAVNDQVVKFELSISSITLTGVSPTATTGNLLAKTSEVEFVHQAGTLEPLTLANVPPGTYNGATFTVSGPEVTVINAGVPTKIPATLSNATVNVTFANLTVGSSPLFINFDLDLANSITLNGAPPTSATVNPTFTVTSTTVAPNQGNEDDNDGENDDIHGSVKSISAPNFTVTTNSADISFATDANTKFKDGMNSLADLHVGDIVEVDSVTKSDGTKLATHIGRESDNKGEELEGIISATTGTPATQITIAHQVDSTNSASTAPTTVDISLNASTQFEVRTDKLNLSTTPAFDASNIGKGQRIEADANGTTAPILAAKLKLREQALFGTVATTPAPGASGFTLTLSPTSAFATLTGATSIPVTIVNGTNLQTTPSAGATVRVRGLVFFNAGTYTMIATRVDNNN